MGNTLSRGTQDVIYILFPFVMSAGLIIVIVIFWWKCKLMFSRGRDSRSRYPLEPDFGHLINIQEYAENQVGTTIVYGDPASGSLPYVYFSDGHITRVVPLTPSPSYSIPTYQDPTHGSCPSALLCTNMRSSSNGHNRMNGLGEHQRQIGNGNRGTQVQQVPAPNAIPATVIDNKEIDSNESEVLPNEPKLGTCENTQNDNRDNDSASCNKDSSQSEEQGEKESQKGTNNCVD